MEFEALKEELDIQAAKAVEYMFPSWLESAAAAAPVLPGSPKGKNLGKDRGVL